MFRIITTKKLKSMERTIECMRKQLKESRKKGRHMKAPKNDD